MYIQEVGLNEWNSRSSNAPFHHDSWNLCSQNQQYVEEDDRVEQRHGNSV